MSFGLDSFDSILSTFVPGPSTSDPVPHHSTYRKDRQEGKLSPSLGL